MLLLLAQLVSPPLQPGPVRLPNPTPVEQPKTEEPIIQPGDDTPRRPEDDSSSEDPFKPQQQRNNIDEIKSFPKINGETPYSQAELQTLLSQIQL